jgi:hypothetical protein
MYLTQRNFFWYNFGYFFQIFCKSKLYKIKSRFLQPSGATKYCACPYGGVESHIDWIIKPIS